MENNETQVVQQDTETQVQPQEQPQQTKMYTQEEVDSIVGKSKARTRAKVQKEFEQQYGELAEVLKAGTGKEDMGEIASDLRKFYTDNGMQMPQKSTYSDKDIQILAKADADEIIRAGDEEVDEELQRLMKKGHQNMTARDKAMFKTLAEHKQTADRVKALAGIGVSADVYGSKEFTDFAAKFAPNTPVTEIYDIYQKTQPKNEIQTMGSMKNTNTGEKGVKEYYTPEEAKQFTRDEIRKNPALRKAIEDSMLKWK